ncbi:MAG: M15 family metallopeptidase [Eubacteriales bacterium]|nr:M15 family metallopeptidase [Eubacteriales bacterium]
MKRLILQSIVSVVALSVTLLQGSMNAAMPDKNIEGTLFLVNRTHMISENYIPEVRKTDVYGMSQSMRNDAATALEEMFTAAKADGVGLSTVSGYRSYAKQGTIYSRKVKTNGQETADMLSAVPGASEHQLGMAMDVSQRTSSRLNGNFAKTKAGQWVAANAYRFGFIVRYQEGKEAITGYAYEPWHIRYVGREFAKEVFDSGEPLDTYVSAHRLDTYQYLLQITNEVYP